MKKIFIGILLFLFCGLGVNAEDMSIQAQNSFAPAADKTEGQHL